MPVSPAASATVSDQPGQLKGGAILPALRLTSIADEIVSVPDPARIVHMQFRRFAGCPVCSRHLRAMAPRIPEIEAEEIREVVFFYSPAEDVRKHVGDLPFTFVGDPEKRYFSRLGVHAAPRSLLSPRAWGPIVSAAGQSLVAMARGAPMPPLNPRGGRFGLPADFLIASNGIVIAAKYGEHVNDQWSADDVLRLVRTYRETQAAPSRTEAAAG